MKAFISRRDFLKAAGITAAAAALAGCSSSNGGGSASGSSTGGKTIRIGVFEPASGDNGAGGKQEVLAVVDGKIIIRRLQKRPFCLLAENPRFSPIRPVEGQEVRIWGVVTACLKKLL